MQRIPPRWSCWRASAARPIDWFDHSARPWLGDGADRVSIGTDSPGATSPARSGRNDSTTDGQPHGGLVGGIAGHDRHLSLARYRPRELGAGPGSPARRPADPVANPAFPGCILGGVLRDPATAFRKLDGSPSNAGDAIAICEAPGPTASAGRGITDPAGGFDTGHIQLVASDFVGSPTRIDCNDPGGSAGLPETVAMVLDDDRITGPLAQQPDWDTG